MRINLLASLLLLGLGGGVVVVAEQGPFVNDAAYLAGQYGATPLDEYVTFNHSHLPRLHLGQTTSTCDDGNHYLFCTRGHSYVYDSRGYLVWAQEGALDEAKLKRQKGLSVKTFKGKQYLAYFEGDTKIVGHGQGAWYMLDSSYRLAYTITGKNGYSLDFHEFTVTEQGTAIVLAYVLHPADLSPYGGPAQGNAWDSVFQEINIETGELLFEWHASKHFRFSDMVVNSYAREDIVTTGGWDWYHINSVEKDRLGNYLISSRYASSISYINGQTGQVMWNLGGKLNSFTDVSAVANSSLDFFCQHMPRWTDNYTAITVFDNGAYWGEKRRGARGLKIVLNTEATVMTSDLVAWWQTPELQISESEGSFTFVPGSGNIFLGMGYQPVWAEFAPNGTMLCETSFASQAALEHETATNMPISTSTSYRTFKTKWVGQPSWPPSTGLVGEDLYVSWNGATEVRAWQLEAASSAEPGGQRWSAVARVNKVSFETRIPHYGSAPAYRIMALDAENHQLGTWLLDKKAAVVQDLGATMGQPGHGNTLIHSLGFFLIALGTLMLLAHLRKMTPLELCNAWATSGVKSARLDEGANSQALPAFHSYSDSLEEAPSSNNVVLAGSSTFYDDDAVAKSQAPVDGYRKQV